MRRKDLSQFGCNWNLILRALLPITCRLAKGRKRHKHYDAFLSTDRYVSFRLACYRGVSEFDLHKLTYQDKSRAMNH
jgi:hypothetical protein